MKKNHELRTRCTADFKEGINNLYSITETGFSKEAFILELIKAGANHFQKKLK